MSGATKLMLAMGGAPGTINGALPSGVTTGGSPASYNINNTGSYTISGQSAGNWVTPASAANAAYFQVKVDPTDGAFDSGTTGTWLDCSSTRSWTRSTEGSVIFTISFREKATGLVRSTQAGVGLDAQA